MPVWAKAGRAVQRAIAGTKRRARMTGKRMSALYGGGVGLEHARPLRQRQKRFMVVRSHYEVLNAFQNICRRFACYFHRRRRCTDRSGTTEDHGGFASRGVYGRCGEDRSLLHGGGGGG